MTYYDSDRSAEFSFGGPRNVKNIVGICIHTTEGVASKNANAGTADSVTTYQVNSQTGSYHVMVGVDGKRIRQNTDGWITWSTGNKGNNILLHLCFVGQAAQTRADWLAQEKMLKAGATVVKYWSDLYKIPLKKVDAAGLPGVLGHRDTRVWGGTDHTDPGTNFPYDVFLNWAKGTTSAVATPPVNLINVCAAANTWLGARLDTNEVAVTGGRAVRYMNGTVYWTTNAAAAFAVPSGGILEAYMKLGGTGGALGLPTMPPATVKGGKCQAFRGGVLYVKDGSASGVGFIVTGAILARFAKAGYEQGTWGWPTSSEMKQQDGTIYQTFDNVTAYFSPDGVFIAAVAKNT